MGTMIQIRNVPDALHRRLKSHAALAGMSLSDYLLSEIRQVAERPTIDELRARLRSRAETAPVRSPAEAVRAERDRACSSLTLRSCWKAFYGHPRRRLSRIGCSLEAGRCEVRRSRAGEENAP
jgi:plasmid stability protein